MTREEFYKLTDILNSEVLGNFMHGGEADELIAMFEEVVEHSNILEQEEPVINDLEEAAKDYEEDAIFYAARRISDFFKAGAQWQKEQTIDKACEWLRDNIDKYLYNTGGYEVYIPKCGGKMFDDFKKAMEE